MSFGLTKESGLILLLPPASSSLSLLCLGLTKESGLILPLPPASSSLSLLRLVASPRSQGSFCCFQQPHPATNCCVLQFLQRVRTASTGLIESQFALSIGLIKGSCSFCCFHQPHQVSVCVTLCPLASPRSQGSFCCFYQPHEISVCCVHWPHQGVRVHFAASISLMKFQFAVSLGLTKESGLILLLSPSSSNFILLCPCSFCCFRQPHQVSVCCVHWPHQRGLILLLPPASSCFSWLFHAHFAASGSLIKSEFAVSIGLTKGSCSFCCFHQPHQVSVWCDFVSIGLTKESGLILLLPPAS